MSAEQINYSWNGRCGGNTVVAGPQSGQGSVARIARLLALAIRIDGLVRERAVPDYAAVARLGLVSRARMTQIMKLLDLAPDLQEEILFLPFDCHLTERRLRPIVQRVDWDQQRGLFRGLIEINDRARPHAQARGQL
jgi:hypothetical protein